MGADARWVCHTCKTVCSRGGKPWVRFKLEPPRTRAEVIRLRDIVSTLNVSIDLNDMVEDIFHFLNDLNTWLSRHETHNIHIGSDYSTDMMDLGDYYNESVDGKKSDATRIELQTRSVEEWRKTGVEKIKGIIEGCKLPGAYGVMTDTDKAAEMLYDKFCEDMAAERGG